MNITPTSHARRFGQRLISQARTLLAVSALAAVALPHRAAAQSTQTLTILGGSGTVGAVAPNVEYYNPATGLWQPTYFADFTAGGYPNGHPWGYVVGTNQWINYRVNGLSDPSASNTNAIWYLYRVRFTVPSDAVNPSMNFYINGDNYTQIAINGLITGGTTMSVGGVTMNNIIQGGPNHTNTVFNADAAISQAVHVGENTITIRLADTGGVNGLNFRIDLSMQSSQPLQTVADGAPTTSDSIPTLNVPANITTNATSAAGAPVSFNATATSHETVEIFRRSTATAEQWNAYTTTFTSGVTGNFTLSFNVVSASGGDNSIFVDAVKLTSGASTLLSDGFEIPDVSPSSGVFADTGDVTVPVTLGSNWTFTNYGGIMQGPAAPNWGSIANETPPEGSQHAVLRDVASKQTKMAFVNQISLVAGQTYTLSFDQASREVFGGALTYTVTLERQISVPVTATPASGSTFPVGTTTVNLSATTNGGTVTGSFNVTVNKLPVTFTLGNLTQTYDGTAKSITVTPNPANVAYVINYLGDHTNAGSCPVQVLPANPIYSGSASDTLVINKAASTTTVTINGAPFIYNGSALTPATVTVTGAGGLNLTPSASYANNTNAGTATASYSYAGDANHTGSSDSQNFAIAKATSTTVVTINGGPFTYDGSAQTPATVSVTGAGGLSLTPTASYTNNTNAGTSTASYSYTGDANHTGSSDSKDFTIDKATSTTVVTINGGPFIYSGLAQTPATVAVTGAGGLNLTPSASYANNTNAGTATASYAYAGDDNHSASSDSKTFTIDKANATVVVTPYNVTYDGNSHTAGVSINGVNGESGATVGVVALNSTHTDAGSYSADTWGFTGAANYNDIATTTINDIIAKANATINVSGYTGIYDGAAHGATGTATGVGGTSVGTLSLGATFTNVPGGTANWTFAGGNNYNDKSGSVEIAIAKAPSVTTTFGASPFTYDGTTHSGGSGTVAGAGVIVGSATLTYSGDQVDAGTYSVTAHYAGDTNHTPSDGAPVAITINKANASVVVAPYNVTYDGQPHSATVTSITGVNGETSATVGSVTLNTTHTGAGTYATDSWSFTGTNNYNDIASTAITDTIAKASTKTVLAAVPTVQALGQTVTLTATVTSVTPVVGTPDGTVTFNLGSTVLGTATVSGGVATLTTTALPLGPQSITATYSGSSNFIGSASNAVSILIYGYPTGGGTFVIGDGNAAVGNSVTFWGSQWEKINTLSGGASNASFKGFAVSMSGSTFTAAPGNSGPSPASVPSYLGVIVTSKVTKSGSNISGTIVKLVVVKTNAGYAGDPGNAGTGTVVAVVP